MKSCGYRKLSLSDDAYLITLGERTGRFDKDDPRVVCRKDSGALSRNQNHKKKTKKKTRTSQINIKYRSFQTIK